METFKLIKAHDANGDLSKRWFISYHFRNPKTGLFERHRETGDINRIKNVRQRREALFTYKQAKEKLLQNGWSPYESYNVETIYQEAGLMFTTIYEAIEKVLEHKKLYLQKTSYTSYKNRINSFKRFLETRKLLDANLRDISKRHIIDFLDLRVKVDEISNRSRNNILIDIKSLYSCMVDLELLEVSPALNIKNIPQTSERNEIYSEEELSALMEWMEQNDSYLLLFCKFIYYTMIRPVELTRLQIKNIDLKNRVIKIPASKSKNKCAFSVPIMDIFMPSIEAMKLETYPPDYFLFSSRKCPFIEPTTRDYFTSKFKKAKDALGISDNQTMYGLKHTSICQLLRKGAPESEIRKYSRHKTSEAFNAYSRQFNMERASDLSNFF